jgi:small subunit ribosomal protein S17
MTTEKTIKGKALQGKVISKKMNKTIVVEISHMFRHPLYRKATRTTKRYLVHSENEAVQVGDTVTITETRPISKLKRFIVKA